MRCTGGTAVQDARTHNSRPFKSARQVASHASLAHKFGVAVGAISHRDILHDVVLDCLIKLSLVVDEAWTGRLLFKGNVQGIFSHRELVTVRFSVVLLLKVEEAVGSHALKPRLGALWGLA